MYGVICVCLCIVYVDVKCAYNTYIESMCTESLCTVYNSLSYIGCIYNSCGPRLKCSRTTAVDHCFLNQWYGYHQ